MKNTAHVDFSDENLNNVRSVQINSLPSFQEHSTPTFFVDNAKDEPTKVRTFKNVSFFNISWGKKSKKKL